MAVKLTEFALDKSVRTENRLYELTREVQLVINKLMIRRYEGDNSRKMFYLLKTKTEKAKLQKDNY